MYNRFRIQLVLVLLVVFSFSSPVFSLESLADSSLSSQAGSQDEVFKKWYAENRNLVRPNYTPVEENFEKLAVKSKILMQSRRKTSNCDAFKSLSESEKVSIMLYTSTGSETLNSALWKNDRTLLKKIEPFSKTLTRALEKLPQESGVVYRYALVKPELLQAYTVGKKVSFPGFTSTSSYKGWDVGGSGYGNVFFRISTQKGKNIECLSKVPEEREWLLDKNSVFEIIRAKSTAENFLEVDLLDVTDETSKTPQ